MSSFKLKKTQGKIWQIEECSKDDCLLPQYLINSQISKEKELHAILSNINFRYHKNFIIFGMKNIELLAEIYKRKTPFSTMIIIEICKDEDEEIYIECNDEKISFLFDKNTVNIVIGSGNGLIKQLDSVLGQAMKLYNLRNIEILSMPYLKALFPTEIDTVTIAIFERLHAIIKGFGNSVEDILVGTDNYINNWKHIFSGIDYSHFKDMYNGKPAIIVGAGPSLDKNIKQLKAARGKILILCVDAALDSLLDEDIVPDIVASIERTGITTKFYKRQIIPESIVYLGPNIIHGSIFERFNRIVFTGRAGDALIRELNEHIGFNNLDVGGNVAHILLAFAQYLGCNPIIFVGLDLAYTDGRTHTVQVVNSLDVESINNVYKSKESIMYVKGQNGELLETFEFFMYAKTWIEMQILKQQGRKYINSTEGGANIEGAENQKLSEVISNCCKGQDLITISDEYDELFTMHQVNKIDTTEKALGYFSVLEKYFKNISKVSKSYYNKINKESKIKIMETQRFKMEKELDKNSAGRFILQSVVISFHRDIQSYPMYLSKEDEKEMLERSMHFYNTLNMISKKVNETIKIYKKVLNSQLNIFKSEEGAV